MKLTPEIKAIKKGQWLFSCSMKPLQFDHWDEKYNDFDGFYTIEGSSHSVSNCSLSPISDEYAKFFIENKCDELFDASAEGNYWDAYENAVKELCTKHSIKYEGI